MSDLPGKFMHISILVCNDDKMMIYEMIILWYHKNMCEMIYIYRRRAKSEIPVGPTTKSRGRQKPADDI